MSYIRHKIISGKKYAYEVTSFRDPETKKVKNNDLSSQNIRRVLAYLGQEEIQRSFFKRHLKSVEHCQENIIIDASSLPNQIHHSFSEWGHADNSIEKQFRFLCVLDQETKTPLFYRFLPGNIVDISTLKTTISELKLMGGKNKYVLLDAGYYSEENMTELYENNIDFLIRLPSHRSLYKSCVLGQLEDIEQIHYATKQGKRVLFVKPIEITLYGNPGWAYVILDPTRKAKEINARVSAYLDDHKEQCYWLVVNTDKIDFRKIKLPKNGVSSYVKIENNNEQLFYIKNQNRQVELLSIKKEYQEELLEFSKENTNKSFLSKEQIKQLERLSGHKKISQKIEQESLEFYFKKFGTMILISSKKIESTQVIASYNLRQNIEQVFGFFKDDLDSLPIRRHNYNTIKGYLFLQFREKLEEKYTVEQAILLARNLKCKVFEKNILVLELNKKQAEIYQLAGVVVPKNLGV